MSSIRTPRDAALQILKRVEEGAWASEVLRGLLKQGSFDVRDAAFITELAYGTLRRRLEMDYVIGRFSRYPVKDLDPPVRNILRMGLYQLLYMRVPAYAACDRAVQSARRAGHGRATGLVNGILRNVARSKNELKYPSCDEDPVQWISVRESHPEWVVRSLIADYGVKEALELCRANNQAPTVDLRVNRRRISRDDLRRRLADNDTAASSAQWAPDGLYWESSGSPHYLQVHRDGLVSVQSEGSQLAVVAAGAEPGIRVLDACAGRGGKTSYLGEIMDNCGDIVAEDLHQFKLKVALRECRRLGLDIVRTRCVDARSPAPDSGQFDLVLVDAPCSGTGIFGRHPDARWHRDEDIAGRMQKLQREILASAARRVRNGGVLLYCTCSVLSAENEEVVRWFLQGNGDFDMEQFPSSFPAGLRKEAKQGMLGLLPHRHGTDGFFLARLRRHGEVDS